MQEKRYTLIADFAIEGRLAYLSHQETLTCLARSFLRAELAVAFSKGFNPRPRLSIALPRSVGTQSRAERICAILAEGRDVDPENVKLQLGFQLPEGCHLLAVRCAEGKCSFHAESVRYVFVLTETIKNRLAQHLADCRGDVGTGRRIDVQRYRAKRKIRESFDISPYVN
jgi:radical SAM-linked protein